MYKLEDWAAVHRVYQQTGSKRKTAKILNISRNTVKKLLEAKEAPAYKRTVYPSILDDYKERIIEWRCKPYEFNGTRIFKELQKIGYQGSIGPLYTYLRKVDEDTDRISSKATVRIETPPGDQAQFDWTEYSMDVGGQIRKVYCFAMILAASRKKAICFSLTVDAAAIYEAIQELFEDLGGVTAELLIDNPKALVIENNPGSEEEIRYNPHALLLAKHLGTELNACPCYWPRKKGKIESPFKYIEEQFVKGNTFATMEELTRRGKKFIEEWCNEKHSTTRRIPNEHFLQEEKATLRKLPAERFHHTKSKTRMVSPDSFVSIDSNKYSVPVTYVGKKISYRLIYGFRIQLYDPKGLPICTWEKSLEQHSVCKEEKHYEAIAQPFSTSIPQIRRDFTERFPSGKKYLDAADKKFDQPTHHARKILLLTELYDDETLEHFIKRSIQEDKMDIQSFKGMLREHNAGKSMNTDDTITHSAESSNPSTDCRRDSEETGLTRDCSYYEEYAR